MVSLGEVSNAAEEAGSWKDTWVILIIKDILESVYLKILILQLSPFPFFLFFIFKEALAPAELP